MSRRNFTPPPSPAPRSRSRRGLPWGKLFLLGLIGVLALAWFAPMIVMKTSLRDRVLKTALQGFPGRVVIGSASAGWLSPIELKGASAVDGQSQEVLTVASVRTEKNLLSLLLDRQHIGTIRIEQPKLKLVLRPDGSNVEDLLKPWLDREKSSSPIGLAVEIIDGSVEATHAGSAVKWQLDKLNANVAIPQSKVSPLTARITTNIAAAGAAPGTLAADVQWQSAPTTTADGPGASAPAQGTATIQTNGLPLDIVTLALRRAGLDIQLAGLLTADAALTVTDKMQTAKIQKLAAQNLFIASPALLGADQIQLATVTGSGEISRGNGEWQFRNVIVESDIAALKAAGAGPSAGANSVGAELTRAFRRGNWEVRGNLDVAKLAAMLPTTLRLREGTHVSSGQLTVALTSQAKPEGNVWNAELQANQLAAIHAGTAFEWKKPIVVKAAVREATSGIIVDQFTCDSTFLQLSGAGTLEQGQFAVNGDLSQFVNEVGRFVDLGSVRAAGKFRGKIDWKNDGRDALALAGNGSATDFELTYVADRPWQEKQLDVQFNSAAKVVAGRITQIDRGNLNVTAAGDNLEAELLKPLTEISSTTTWPVHVRVRGDLGRWLARMQMFVTLDGWQIDGDDLDLEGDLQASKQRLEFVTTRGPGGDLSGAQTGAPTSTRPIADGNRNYATIKNFLFNGSGLTIQEPTLQIETKAAYDVVSGEFTSPETIISGSTIALRAEKTRLLFHGGQIALDGDVQYRTNLDRLSSWLRDVHQPATYRVQGEATGTIHLAYASGATKADATASIDNFVYSTPARVSGLTITPVNQAPGWQELWKEPRLEVAVQGSLDASGQQATLEKLEVAGDSLSIGAAGAIRQPFNRCELDLSGQYAYDLERLSQRLRGMIGPQVQMTGTGQRPFSIRGPLLAASSQQPTVHAASSKTTTSGSFASLQEMLAEASVAWQTLVIQGFEVGAGEVATKLDKGVLTISPINLPVSEGKIAVAPRIDVTQTPYIATLEPGTLVDHVRISPQMCRSWLKYLAPMVADATAAEGHFSVVVDEARFPVTDPTGGNVQGKLLIHTAQIGPGPLSQEILGVVQLIKSVIDKRPVLPGQPTSVQWLDMPEQQLNLQLTEHRVYHRDMKFLVNDVAVTTSGWVGLDQQLALVAEVPVLDAWVAKDRYLASLKGQTIRLPISGTLSRPQVDRTALRELTRQTVIGAGSNLLQDEVSRGLNKLFQPKGLPVPVPQQQPPR